MAIEAHAFHLCAAEEFIRLGHKHLIVHVLGGQAVAFVAGNAFRQMDRSN